MGGAASTQTSNEKVQAASKTGDSIDTAQIAKTAKSIVSAKFQQETQQKEERSKSTSEPVVLDLAAATAAQEKVLSNNKLKKMALGIQGYKDVQRDYDSTLSTLDLNKTGQVEWRDPKMDAPFTPNKTLENKFSSPQLIAPSHSSSIILSPADKRKLKEMASPEILSSNSSFSAGPRGNSASFYGGVPPPSGIPVRPFPKDRARQIDATNEDKNISDVHVPPMQGGPSPHVYHPHQPHPQSPHVIMAGPPPQMMMMSPAMNYPPGAHPPMIVNGINTSSSNMNSNKGGLVPGAIPIPMNGQPPPRMVLMSPTGAIPVVIPPNTVMARPPSSSAPVPVVKETKNVKRNKVQLPTTYTHEKPTTGDWLNKRYIVNNYILLDTLGSGSYGEVRLCKERVSDKLYAIKIISKEFLKKKKNGKTSETYFEDIKREIAIMKKLLHPNILRLYEVLDDPKVNKMYLVLEYMKRGDLINVLKKRTEEEKKQQGIVVNNNGDDINTQFSPLPDFDLWHIFRQIVSGIRYLHFQNIVHGDIKPQNLLLGEDGIVKVADFGISQMLSGSGEKLADAGGTPAFMAPELCENKSFSGQLADIWAIGATIYMLKFGYPPFIAKNIVNLYYKICNDPLVFPYAIDPGLKNLLEGLLEKDPEKRMTMIQVVAHPWFRFPPSSVPKVPPPIPKTANNTSSTATPQQTSRSDDKQTPRGLSSKSDDQKPSGGLFQPPPTYDAEEEAAMKGPIHSASLNEVYMSIGGIRNMSDPNVNIANLNLENAITDIEEDLEDGDDDEDDEAVEDGDAGSDDEKGAKSKPKKPKYDLRRNKEVEMKVDDQPNKNTTTSSVAAGEKRVSISKAIEEKEDEKEENFLQTNWGNDVFQIVEDLNDEDEDMDEIDEDDEDDSEKKDKVHLPKRSEDSDSLSPMLTRHNEMTAEEEMRRSRQFLKKNANKKSQQDVKSTGIADPSRSSRSSNGSSHNHSQLTSPVSTNNLKGGAKDASSPGTSSSTTTTPSNALHKRFFPPPKENSGKLSSRDPYNHSRVSLLSNNDVDEEPEQLSNEEFQKLMDTLSQQPSKATNITHKSYDPDDYNDDDDDDDVLYEDTEKQHQKQRHSLEFLIAPQANHKNEIGCAYYSEQGQRPTQEDRFIVQANLLQYFTQHNLFSVNPSYENNSIPNLRESLAQISMAAVFDGHNGHKTSQYLSHHFLKRLVENEKCLESKHIENTIKETFYLLDYEIVQMLKAEEDPSGSTGVVVWFDGRKNMLTVAGIGDSLCVLSRNGRAIVMNKMHRLDIVSEKERVRNNGGTVINSRVNGVLAVSRAFGDIQFKSIGNNLYDSSPQSKKTVSTVNAGETLSRAEKLQRAEALERESLITAEPHIRSEIITPKTEFAIIATDGVWDVMAPQVAVRFVRDRLMEHKDLQRAVKELTHEALANHSVDNVTIVLVTFHTSFTSIK